MPESWKPIEKGEGIWNKFGRICRISNKRETTLEISGGENLIWGICYTSDGNAEVSNKKQWLNPGIDNARKPLQLLDREVKGVCDVIITHLLWPGQARHNRAQGQGLPVARTEAIGVVTAAGEAMWNRKRGENRSLLLPPASLLPVPPIGWADQEGKGAWEI